MESTKTYSLKSHHGAIGPIDILSGTASDGDVFTITSTADVSTAVIGNDSSVVICENPQAALKTFTLRLMQTSKVNSALWAAYNAAQALGAMFAGPLLLRDTDGTLVASCPAVYIQKVPDVKRGKEVQTAEWVFHAPHCVIVE